MKHEYVAGTIQAMSSARVRHNRICLLLRLAGHPMSDTFQGHPVRAIQSRLQWPCPLGRKGCRRFPAFSQDTMMRSWIMTCLILALGCLRSPSLAHQMAPVAVSLALLPLTVLFNTADLKRLVVQLLVGPVFVVTAIVFEHSRILDFGTLAPLAVVSLFCLANTMAPPPYTLGLWLVQMSYFGTVTAVYVSRNYWSPEIGLTFSIVAALVQLVSRTPKSFQAAPGGRLGDIPIGSENEKQTGLFILYLFSAFFTGLILHLALGFPRDWLFNSVLLSAAISSALYCWVLLLTGLHLGPADRWGGHPGPRFSRVSQVPWKSYGLALPWLFPGLCIPFRTYESETLMLLRVGLFLVGIFFLCRPVLGRRH